MATVLLLLLIKLLAFIIFFSVLEFILPHLLFFGLCVLVTLAVIDVLEEILFKRWGSKSFSCDIWWCQTWFRSHYEFHISHIKSITLKDGISVGPRKDFKFTEWVNSVYNTKYTNYEMYLWIFSKLCRDSAGLVEIGQE